MGKRGSQREDQGGGGFKSREFQIYRVTSGSYVMQVFFFFASPGPDRVKRSLALCTKNSLNLR